jgi:hypothetical protein
MCVFFFHGFRLAEIRFWNGAMGQVVCVLSTFAIKNVDHNMGKETLHFATEKKLSAFI